MCLSYFAGQNRPRYRGRLYVPCALRNIVPSGAFVSTASMNNVATARGLIQHGITVNAFAPGVVDTPMWNGLNDDLRAIHEQPGRVVLDDQQPVVLGDASERRASLFRHHYRYRIAGRGRDCVVANVLA